jgi:hypothetical protein
VTLELLSEIVGDVEVTDSCVDGLAGSLVDQKKLGSSFG